jgi:amidase
LALWLGWTRATPLLAQASTSIAVDEATIAQLNTAFDTSSLTAEQLVKICLSRIKAYDKQGPSLRALITVNPDAVEAARHLDFERRTKGRRSALHGIPVVLKDNIGTADMPTTAGSVMLEGSVPSRDAFIVERLRQAGAVILAKANMSEFASSPPISSIGGQMKNPHDLARTPLGSSGGSGVAVASAYTVVAIGTDTGGSIRNPSFTTGIVGLKPTLGLISRRGIVPLGPYLRHGRPPRKKRL